MKLFLYLFTVTVFTVSCNFQNNTEKNQNTSVSDTSKTAALEIIIEANNMVTLPQLEGIEVFLQNNTEQTIKIWETANPSGLLEVYFLFENDKNEKLRIDPIVLNWKSDFSKGLEIKPDQKIKLNTQITHWYCNNSELEKTDFTMDGKLKAYYSVKETFKEGSDFWKGEISSNEVQVELKHSKFADKD
jgi:hypothetical protein